jgi:hypothetical protein
MKCIEAKIVVLGAQGKSAERIFPPCREIPLFILWGFSFVSSSYRSKNASSYAND